MSTAPLRAMFDPIVVWFGVAVACGSLALIVAAWTHHARLARLGALLGISAMLVVAYLGIAEPWIVRWGAASSEVVGGSWHRTTRSISIAAPAERVWHLLVLEESCGACVTRHVVPGRALVQRCPSVRRVFIVDARTPVTSRLITRTATRRQGPPIARMLDRVVATPARFVRERRLLTHLRSRAEGRPVYAADEVADATPWVLALALAIISAIGAMVARRGWTWVGMFASSALALLVLPLAHPPPAIGLLWTLGTLSALAGVVLRGPPDHEPRF